MTGTGTCKLQSTPPSTGLSKAFIECGAEKEKQSRNVQSVGDKYQRHLTIHLVRRHTIPMHVRTLHVLRDH
jgi:hypothetical protein